MLSSFTIIPVTFSEFLIIQLRDFKPNSKEKKKEIFFGIYLDGESRELIICDLEAD